ncbi:shufflon-specific DNA recombinase [Salmonella enterica subsp. enterica]|nr:shufflon-specific DNA recombinase [Salmonella enterica subsp. enterica]
MTVALTGSVFNYTSSGFKSAWRVALQRLSIIDLHFHDLRHEAISRLFELGTLNVMEVAAISGHRSLNMLKRYTHLRAYQLVSKLDARRRQTQKIAPYFVPYPACIESVNEEAGQDHGYRVHLPDFDGLSASGASRASALEAAGVLLLRTLANAAQRGERVPRPGDLPEGKLERVMIHPLMSTA